MPVPVRAPLGATGGTPEADPLGDDYADPALLKHLPGRFPDCWHPDKPIEVVCLRITEAGRLALQ
jgi:hypothetical protein